MTVIVRPGAASFAACIFVALFPVRACAANYSVPAGRLGEVIVALGVQARVTIVLADPDLAAQRSPGVRANVSLRTALDRALRGTGAEAVFHGPSTVQIRRRRLAPPPRKAPVSTRSPVRRSIEQTDIVAGPDIVVTASKQELTLDRYPGAVKIVKPERGWISSHAADGMSAITQLLPAMGATNLGNGRNKLFIRGIADSSFSGPTQATTGQYLGDIRLTYNAPDPDLNLYDMKQFEVLVGPQGSLYGAGSLGGIVRLVPNVPDAEKFSASAAANTSVTRHGSPSADGAIMVNVPLAKGRLAVRIVAFGGMRGGYIDAPVQGRRDINRTASYGQRLSLRADDLEGWTVDVGAVLQNIRSEDGQYVLRDEPMLTRNTSMRQPFENNYRLGYVSANRSIGALELRSVTSVAHHELSSLYDATGYDGAGSPARYTENNEIELFSHETRLSGGQPGAPWVAGISLTKSISTLILGFDPLVSPISQGGIRSSQAEAAAFGQMSLPVTSTLAVTAGGRMTFAHSARRLIDASIEGLDDPQRNELRFSGTFGVNWRPGGPISAFYHYQQGYRPGGLGIALSDTDLTTRQFVADDLQIHELGMRWHDRDHDRFSGQMALFIADWRNIQADLIGDSVVPITSNIGRGIIHGLDVEMTWKPVPSLTFSASAFLNESRLIEPAPGFVIDGSSPNKLTRTLPNVARNGGRFGASWRGSIGSNATWSLDASIRYVGRSHLGLGELLDVPQGDYTVADAGARLEFGRLGVSLAITNIADSYGNTFSYGNPFGLAARNQMTPVRPRTLRMGVDMQF
ncbi:TonB-dependent receptor domain-containing protein [Novosphingobium barchaimii]|uniref:TonB-dependent receptor domain-containing protein n=1 Tax=Novosphingobium barchaimii TaxID=1420591 RepID=UPI0007410140|nr:TonB-dependent receptor [Novosphingobium barchaimii]